MSRALIIFGDKTANEILAIAQLQHENAYDSVTRYYFDPQANHTRPFQSLLDSHDQVDFNIGVIDVTLRSRIREQAMDAGMQPISVIHPTAVIAQTACVGAGCFIGPYAVISEDAAINGHSIIHIHASIGHNSRLGQDCVILPGARISGEVSLGNRVLVGSNAFIYQNIAIGDDVQIDALTYVRHSVQPGMLVSTRLGKPVKRVT